MRTVNLAAAKAKLSELVAEAEAGGEIVIERRGKPAARLVPVEPATVPYDWDEHRRWLETMPLQTESGADLVRRMRDEYRY